MAILIKDPETDRLVRALAARTGETLTEAVRKAAAERLQDVSQLQRRFDRAGLEALLAEVRAYPVVDSRTPDEIIGYDENGLPA
jgi:antitoxin VapB